MKKILILTLFGILLFSCKSDDDNEVVGTYIWAPNIGIGLSDRSATVYLSDPRPYSNYVAPGPENPDYFEVLISEDLESFELHRRLDSFSDSLKVENLINGKDYYFKVTAHRKGFETVSSNVVMTIPSLKLKVEAYQLGIDFSFERFTFSKDLKYITFYAGIGFDGYNSQDLLVRDMASGYITPLGYFSSSGDWSSTSNNLVYMTSTIIEPVVYHDKIMIYNAVTKEINELLAVNYDTDNVSNPIFSSDAKTIGYLSSKGNSENYIYDFWSIDLETKEETKLSDFEGLGFFMSGGYHWAKTDKEMLVGGSLDLENYVENIFKYNIRSKKLEPIIESQWRDSRPALSPDESKIAFISDRSGLFSEDIWLYNTANSQYKRLTGNGPHQQFYSPSSNLLWLDNNHLLITLFNPDNGKSEAYTIEVN